MDRFSQWNRRLMGAELGLPLGKPSEFWRLIPDHPATDWVRQQRIAQQRDASDESVAYYMTRSLLLDVLHAAGGIEYTVGKIDSLMTALDAVISKLDLESREPSEKVAHQSATEAIFEYANLLSWVATLQDRMRSSEPRHGKRGLIPSLTDDSELQRSVRTIYDRLDRKLGEEKNLRNFALHMHALPSSGTAVVEVTPEGKAKLRIPDQPKDPVYLFDQFTYAQDRDLQSFAHATMETVERFIDELLGAFEEATRDYLQRTHGAEQV